MTDEAEQHARRRALHGTRRSRTQGAHVAPTPRPVPPRLAAPHEAPPALDAQPLRAPHVLEPLPHEPLPHEPLRAAPRDAPREPVSDAGLIAAVRAGDRTAYECLYERHVGAALAVARHYTRSEADADDVVAEAFERVLSALGRGQGPDVAFRAYLFTVVRRVAVDRSASESRTAPVEADALERAADPVAASDDAVLGDFERGAAARAFRSLPERWQAVLWYTEIEGRKPAEVAVVLGLTPGGVAALAYRAREGLRQAFLQQHVGPAPASRACTAVSDSLGGYVRGGLGKRQAARVEAHVATCTPCQARVIELDDVGSTMRVLVAPAVLGATSAAVLAAVRDVALGAAGAWGAGVAGAGAGAGAGA
ncbi:sigma-70 family RNA polymerase sigma factor, partial [Cellulomonas carbonis]